MNTKLGTIISFIGLVYVAIGIAIIYAQESISKTYINISMAATMMFSIMIHSLFNAVSDLIIQIYINRVITKRISKIVVYNYSEESEIYNRINEVKTVTSKPIKAISNALNVLALPISIFIIFTLYLPHDIVLTGITILIFGIVIFGNGLRNDNNVFMLSAEKDLILKFYKHKFKVSKEEKTHNERV